ncbi:hypothetical protein LEP1GSC178_2010 [Leptospira licerasiae str. MMD4847]|uniref:Uncharacterized protein n=1 Tax=Leptospira licerasiae str. MMD4847 TaxID=1049971 RepID=A0ABN0HE88_9LEPT|nr:hypothetical protein LEP1GSC178_2010 [Leptospira licerasiae str. MMD4847]
MLGLRHILLCHSPCKASLVPSAYALAKRRNTLVVSRHILKMQFIKEILESPEFGEKYPELVYHKEAVIAAISGVFEYIGDRKEAVRERFLLKPYDFLWEIHVLQILLKQGKRLVKSETKGPDIIIQEDTNRIVIECVSPADWNPKPRGPGFSYTFHEKEKIYRYSSSIKDKIDKILTYKEKEIILDSDISIIAVSGGMQDFGGVFVHLPDIFKAVYPYGQHIYSIPLSSPEESTVEFENRGNVKHPSGSGAELVTDYFCRDEFAIISGILFNPLNILSDSEFDGNGFHYVHNRQATNPLSTGYLKRVKEYIGECPKYGD